MNNGFFLSLFNRFGLYYGFVDKDLKIYFDNDEVYSFLSLDKGAGKYNLRDVFHEITGSEDDIQKVISGKKREYSIIGINRYEETEKFFNLYFLQYAHNAFLAISARELVPGPGVGVFSGNLFNSVQKKSHSFRMSSLKKIEILMRQTKSLSKAEMR